MLKKIHWHDKDNIHWILMDIQDIIEYNDIKNRRLIKFIYENTPCSKCRLSAIQKMIETNMLDCKIKGECRYDCNEKIRKIVADT
jgi:hypothetical protein